MNRKRVRERHRVVLAVIVLGLGWGPPPVARTAGLCGAIEPGMALEEGPGDQAEPPGEAEPRSSRPFGIRLAWFLGGAAAGLLAHESGHLAFDLAFDADPYLRAVDFHGIPFFAISHRTDIPEGHRFVIASAGFWVQHGTSEWIMSTRPDLHTRRAPFLKGVLAFNVLTSVAYAGSAVLETGPVQRDTRGMSRVLGIDEPWVGAMILVPALLDTYRFVRPQARWARWASRAVKLGIVVLAVGQL